MAIEIERKFLVLNDTYKSKGEKSYYKQGYLVSDETKTVRVRIADEKAYLTIKSKPVGTARAEYDYEIPVSDAQYMLDHLCEKPLVEKYRYKLQVQDLVWEVDEFLGDNEGLVVAEVELSREDQAIELPEWVGREVTGEVRYYNSQLIKKPYKSW
ncbi:MAG TPA: CYTH domain-containing protein [Cytophagaceae bacterium]